MPSALNRLNISPTNRCHPERWVLLGVNAARRAGKQASFTLNLNHSLLKRCRVIVNLPSRASACGPRGGRRRASIAMAGLLARLRECSLLCTRDNHPDRGSPSLWPERCPTLIFKNKAAAWTYGKRVEDTFVSLTCNRTDLAAFSIDEANDRSSCEPRRIRRARSLGTRWSLAALFFLRGDLFPVAGCESEHDENGEQAS